MEAHWRAQTIGKNSILLDPRQVGRAGSGHHNITYGPAGEKPALHSDSRAFDQAYRADREYMPQLRAQIINTEFIEELGSELLGRARNRDGAGRIFEEIRDRRPIEVVQILLGRVYQVSWLLLR